MSVAILFPGQGAQSVGMLADLRTQLPHIDVRLQEASDVVGVDLIELAANGPEERLNQTAFTQPVLLATSVALYEAWHERIDRTPLAVAGHSLGEYSALTAAGVFQFAEAVGLVHERGKFMQEAVPLGEGSMAAVLGLEDAQIEAVCEQIDGVVSPANINSPGQVVIAGTSEAVAEATRELEKLGARRVVPLDVSVPSHCALMVSAEQGLAGLLRTAEMRRPEFPVYQNSAADTATDVAGVRDRLLKQLTSPVRWSATISAMIDAGCERFLECGPGKVLTGLMRRIDRNVGAKAIGDWESFSSSLES